MTNPSSGNDGKKMEWMYRDSSQVVDPEEYLLGRKVDKQLEKRLLPPDKDQEFVPSSNFFGDPVESQVDIGRKLQEDPLYLIRKKEVESREQLLKNPRKLKQLQEMVAKQQAAAEKAKKKQMKKMNKIKRKKELDSLLAKKCKKLLGGLELRKLDEMSSSETSSEDNAEPCKKKKTKDIDLLLATKYKKLLGKSVDAKGLAEISSFSSSESSSEEKNKVKKEWKSSNSYSISTGSSRDDRKTRKSKEYYPQNYKGMDYSRSKDVDHKHKEKIYLKGRKEKFSDVKARSTHKKRSASDTSSESEVSNAEKRKTQHKKQRSAKNKHGLKRSSSEDSCQFEYSELRKQNQYKNELSNDENYKRINSKSYQKSGRNKLIDYNSDSSLGSSAKEFSPRKKIKSKKKKDKRKDSPTSEDSLKKIKTNINPKSRSVHPPSGSCSDSESSSKKQKIHKEKQYGLVLPANYVPKEKLKEDKKLSTLKEKTEEKPYKKEIKKKLTEEEKQKRLEEMMGNAKWRDDLRSKTIKAHEEKLKSEKTKDNYIYNEGFMRNQLAYAISKETVESRIKANINTIQRSSDEMSKNFARRN